MVLRTTGVRSGRGIKDWGLDRIRPADLQRLLEALLCLVNVLHVPVRLAEGIPGLGCELTDHLMIEHLACVFGVSCIHLAYQLECAERECPIWMQNSKDI